MATIACDPVQRTSPIDSEAEGVLLQDVQHYLQCRLYQLAPDAFLTQQWEQFYGHYTSLIHRFAISWGVRAHDLPELLQLVWYEVVARLRDFQWMGNHPKLRAWLFRMVQTKAIDLVRGAARFRKIDDDSVGRFLEAMDPNPGPLANLERQWDHELAHMLLADLQKEVSEENHRILVLHFLEGRTVKEVADLLALTAEQVWARQNWMFRKFRGRRKLYCGGDLMEEPE